MLEVRARDMLLTRLGKAFPLHRHTRIKIHTKPGTVINGQRMDHRKSKQIRAPHKYPQAGHPHLRGSRLFAHKKTNQPPPFHHHRRRFLVKHSALLSPEVVESQAIIAGLVCSSQILPSQGIHFTSLANVTKSHRFFFFFVILSDS